MTSLRDAGSGLAWLKAQNDRTEFTNEPVPRYFFSGEIFEGEQAYWGDGFLTIFDEANARTMVREWKQRGANFIKVYPSLSWSLKRAVAEAAYEHGLSVAGHGMSLKEIVKSITLGFSAMEHNTSGRVYDDLLLMIKQTGVHWDPTLTVMGGDNLLLRDEPERMADAKLQAFTPEWSIRMAQNASSSKSFGDRALRGLFAESLLGVHSAYQLGVKLHIGTDSPNPQCFFGASLHWELEHFVRAGLTPFEVLKIATREAAEGVGADDSLGTIEPGKLADLILLDSDPLEDIRNTQTIWRVFKDGWLFDPEKLRPPESDGNTE